MEQVILEDDFQDQWFKVKLKDVLYQLDCGFDYEEGSLEATSMCDCCKEVDNNKNQNCIAANSTTTEPCVNGMIEVERKRPI